MFCKKCGGRVFLDRMFVGTKKKNSDGDKEEDRSPGVELFCVMCGKRWMLNRDKNRLAAWLVKLEKHRDGAFATSTSK